MSDYGPGSRIKPKALIIQLNPETSDMMEAALRFDVELPSGRPLLDLEHWWKEVTEAQRARIHAIALEAVADVSAVHELTHNPNPPEPEPPQEET